VVLEGVNVVKGELTIKVKAEKGVKYVIEFIGVAKGSERSEVFRRVVGVEAKLKLSADHYFVRARITSDKTKVNPIKEEEFEMAWTQPVIYK
jgi:hypothetical protein